MARIHVDPSARTYLPLCRECGWRGDPEATRLAALASGVRHEHRAHPITDDAQRALWQATRRAKRGALKT